MESFCSEEVAGEEGAEEPENAGNNGSGKSRRGMMPNHSSGNAMSKIEALISDLPSSSPLGVFLAELGRENDLGLHATS